MAYSLNAAWVASKKPRLRGQQQRPPRLDTREIEAMKLTDAQIKALAAAGIKISA